MSTALLKHLLTIKVLCSLSLTWFAITCPTEAGALLSPQPLITTMSCLFLLAHCQLFLHPEYERLPPCFGH